MPPNFPIDLNSNMDYFYDDDLDFPQDQLPHQFQGVIPQYQPQSQPYHHQPQNPQSYAQSFQPQFQHQPRQPHQPQSYPQSLPQNYPQYYQNQSQAYQPDFTQYQPAFYNQPLPNSQPSRQPAQPTRQPVPPPPQPAPQTVRQTAQPRPPPPSQTPPQVVRKSTQLYRPSPSQPQPSPAQSRIQLPDSSTIEVIIPSKHRSLPSQPQQTYQPHPQSQKPSQAIQPPTFSPHVIQEYRPQQYVASHQEPPTTVSLEQVQNKPPPKPTATVKVEPTQPSPQQGKSRVLQAVEITTKSKQPSMKPPEQSETPPKPDYNEPEYPSLLCAVADDFLDAARKLPEVDEEYHELVGTALSCLETALANLKLQPLREAQVSLRYAQVLYEETESYDEAETQLTKSIELCERHKFVDLKYEMQLLLSKVLYQSKPKAALRDIQRMIDDIEAYRHIAWLYVFRFQHAMFSLSSSSPGDVHSATAQLEKIGTLARQSQDSVILAFAAIIEAMLHLSSSNHEAITATQTALAKARALQLNPDVETTPQLTILMEFIDLATSIQECNISQTEQKRKILHDVLYDAINHANWRDDGMIYLPISKRSLAGVQVSNNGKIVERNGKHFLKISWLLKEEAEALGFLLSADSTTYKNGFDNKASKYAKNGLALIRSWHQPTLSEGYEQSQRASLTHTLLEAQFLFLHAFMQASKGRWEQASETISEISQISEDLGDPFPASMKSGLLYLKGSVLQGLGDTSAALAVYQSPTLRLVPRQSSVPNVARTSHQISRSYNAESDRTRDFSILAAMNTAFIIQNPQHPQHNQLAPLLSNIRPAVQTSGSKYIEAHYSILVSVLSTTTLTVKQYLKNAMDAGKATGSTMTTALALIYMQQKMFKGTVDEQAVKCAKAATHQARKWGDPMWLHVASGMEAECLEVNGLNEEAAKRKREADSLWDNLPERVKMVKNG